MSSMINVSPEKWLDKFITEYNTVITGKLFRSATCAKLLEMGPKAARMAVGGVVVGDDKQ